MKGHSLASLQDLHLFQVLLRSGFNDPEDGQPRITGAAAQLELWARLGSGELIAEGIRSGRNERAPLRDAEWIDLDQFYNDDWPTDAIGRQSEKHPRFTGLRVRSADVTRLWPAAVFTDEPAPEVAKHEYTGGAKARQIRLAVKELWPDGQPLGMIKERDRLIIKWFKDKDIAPPNERTIRRVLGAANRE